MSVFKNAFFWDSSNFVGSVFHGWRTVTWSWIKYQKVVAVYDDDDYDESDNFNDDNDDDSNVLAHPDI